MKQMEDIRMKDERDEEGCGYLTIEMQKGNVWTTLTRTWFWNGVPTEVWVQSDDVRQVTMSQYTDKRSAWKKNQFKNIPAFGKHFNHTTLRRKEAPLKRKGDC
jgi:hypothetical protein